MSLGFTADDLLYFNSDTTITVNVISETNEMNTFLWEPLKYNSLGLFLDSVTGCLKAISSSRKKYAYKDVKVNNSQDVNDKTILRDGDTISGVYQVKD